MNKGMNNWLVKTTALVFMLLVCCITSAQTILNKNLSINVSRQRMDDVLEIISNKGNFYFSYNSSIIRKDSLVSLSANNKTVKEILDQLFPSGYEYKESGNYLIIRRAPIRITLVTSKAVTEDKFYSVSGYVLDDETGFMLPNASIYEKTLLTSALTNQNGYFKLRLKSKSKTAALTVSKEFYEDTTVTIEPRYDQQISIAIMPVSSEDRITIVRPEDYFLPDSLQVTVQKDQTATTYTYVRVDSGTVEKTGFGKFLLSSKQRMQTVNLKKFFTERPFQLSVTPGLSTHGSLSSQVINNFSLNVFGGYSGGVNGVELGGLFNIDKKDVKFFQAGGIFNIVGGYVKGVQLGGINNTVLDSVKGFQAAGINNHVVGKLSGFQVSGIYNHVADSVNGVQVAGIGNYARRKVTGTQIAGVSNFANQGIRGTQIAGVVNYAKTLHGVQIGLINIADSSDGYSIGVLNFVVVNGYHKLSLSTDEFINLNASLKTGTRKLYSMLQAGMNWGKTDEKVYSFGYGLGTEISLGKIFSVNPEIASQYLYLGSWDYLNLLNKFRPNFTIKLGKYVSLFGGPVFNVYYSQQLSKIQGYKPPTPPSGYNSFDFSSNVKGWIGWNAGINFF
jgi:hypothetical protein